MNSKGKGIITAVIVVLIALAAFCGFGYISQRMTASEGITYLDKKEYQKAYEQFDHAAGKFTLIFTKQKKDVFILRRRGSLSDGRVWESHRDL